MKKTIFPILLLLVAALVFSFRNDGPAEEKFTITVTADKPSTFDMLQDGKIERGLTTPYVVKVDAGKDSKFIFKSKSGTTGFHINCEGMKGKLDANWPITVLVISGASVSTFGMD